uniref:Uncharacterized protein n=1 Tax=Zooxanthella nutricula TaxID=1333877 RepID=A0A7S2LGW2_9DINO
MFTGKCDQNDPSTFPVGIRYEIFWMDSEPADSVKPMDSPFVRKTASLLDKCRVPHPEPPHVADGASTRTIFDNWEQELLFGIGGDAPAWSIDGPFPTQWECAASDYGCPGSSGDIAARYHAGGKSDGLVGAYQMGAFWLSEVWQPDDTAGDTMHSLFNYHPSAAFFEEMVHSFLGRGPHEQKHGLSHDKFPRAFPDLYQRCDEVPAIQCGANSRYIDSMHQGTERFIRPSAPILMDQYASAKSNPFIDFAYCQAVVENLDSGRIHAGLPNASSEHSAWKQGQIKEMTASANTLAALSLIAYRDALALGASGAPRSYVGLDDSRFIVDAASQGYIGGLALDGDGSVLDASNFQVIRCPGFNRFYGSANAHRLAAMKRSTDPNGVFTQASADFRNMDKDGFFKRDSPEWNALQNRCPPWLNLQDDKGLSDDMLAHLEGYEPDFAFLQAAP